MSVIAHMTVLPCPFCGNETIEVIEGATPKHRVAKCCGCGARAREVPVIDYSDGHSDDIAEEDAINEWNTRA